MSGGVIRAPELEKMTPQERADTINESIVRTLNDLTPEFRAEIEATAARLGAERRARA